MDGSYNKRAVRENSGPKKKQPTAVKDSASSHDGTGTGTPQICNRIGCGGRLNNNNNNTKSTKDKTLEKPKPKPLKPSIRASSSKSFKGGSSKNNSKSTEKNGGNGLRGQTSESNNGGRKRLTRGESSSSGKGKKIIDVSANEARVSGTKSSRNGGSSVRARKLNLEASKGSRNVITITSQAQESSLDGGHSPTDNGRGQYNNDGIADVVWGLDRYQQDEELTYEQVLSLEANLFLGGINLFDQHRDMRLDIDNMSYEELLLLEEKMGTVSTALSEEELSKCIKTSVYDEPLQSEKEKTKHSLCADDRKCSICQEEFVNGDEVGRLGCGHGYHTPCINQWLGLKNWCPICKASPTPA